MKKRPRVKIFRNHELVDRHSTVIRSDQAENLKKLGKPKMKKAVPGAPFKLTSKTSVPIYTAGKMIKCFACEKISPTKRMYRYGHSSSGEVILCEKCDENAEMRSFCRLDALDFPRKAIRIGKSPAQLLRVYKDEE